MKRTALTLAAVALCAAAPVAQATVTTYNVTTTWFEPETQPNDSIFVGTFDFDSATHTVTNLHGKLSESMTGNNVGYPNDSMTWLNLNYQLATWRDDTLGGTFAAAFLNSNTKTFYNPGGVGDHPVAGDGGDFWSPQVGVDMGGVYYGFPKPAKNPGNAYALIFIPDNPLTALNQAQIDKLAYADCAPGGMMGATCMTGTSLAGYGAIGTMSGVPASQTITAAVPEPETYAMMMAGLGLVGFMSRRRKARAGAA